MIFNVSKRNEHLSGIYIIHNDINDKIYIGQTVNFKSRFYNHKSNFLKKRGNCKFIKLFKNINLEFLQFSIIEICEKKYLNEKEKFYINKGNYPLSTSNLLTILRNKYRTIYNKFNKLCYKCLRLLNSISLLSLKEQLKSQKLIWRYL